MRAADYDPFGPRRIEGRSKIRQLTTSQCFMAESVYAQWTGPLN